MQAASLLFAISLLLTTGCGPLDEPSPPTGISHQPQEIQAENGLSANGLSANGLSANGLSANGLSVKGLSTTDFHSWFESDPELADAVMHYVTLCAAKPGESLTYTAPSTGTTYTWYGRLGLAPKWASGKKASEFEQQAISACLAAHTNKYGMHIPISVLGVDGADNPIPYTSSELKTFPELEACFFGNLFTEAGIYTGSDRKLLHEKESTSRACSAASKSSGTHTTCSPLVHAGNCADLCTLDPSKFFYTSCTYNGVTYRPITTRLRTEDIYVCGDGVCQFTERCGTSTVWNDCIDCGPCP